MFTLNDLLDRVECQGEVRVLMIEECDFPVQFVTFRVTED